MSSSKSLDLEQDIAEMEDRLASVKVRVEAERVAWKKSYRTGKSGTKWKGAARGSTGAATQPPGAAGLPGSSSARDSTGGDPDANAIMPSYWDALELAQHLQALQLTAFAQVVIYEQITGRVLLDTAPGKMRQLFRDVLSDPNWKAFLQATARLHTQQKEMERASASFADRSEPSSKAKKAGLDHASPASPRGAPTFFPQISPRVPGLTSTGLRASTSDADDSESEKRRAKAAMPLRKPPTSGQQLATCWNCGSRFPRSQGSVRGELKASTKALSTRTFCSKECQNAIESADMSVSTSVSASLQVNTTARDATRETLASPPHCGTPIKLRAVHKAAQKSKLEGSSSLLQAKTSADGLSDLLQVAHKRGPLDEVPRPAPPPPHSSSSVGAVGGGKPNGAVIRKRIKASGGSGSSISSTRGVLPANIPPLVLTATGEASRHCKVYQQSVYKLDPELYQANGVSLAACFYNGAVASGASATRKNLMRLQEYMSVKALYRLSLTSRAWFEAVHQSALADPLWGFHLLRIWKRSEEDELFLHEIGALSKPERPRQMMMKLTRRVGRVVLENMKTLLSAENWHLAAPMKSHPTLTLQSVLRGASKLTTPSAADAGGPSSPSKLDLSLISADMFEQIALVLNRKGEVVAVRAQELIRPIVEDQTLTDILLGMRTGALFTVECRRLRLFSTANRLPFEQWHVLPQCRVVFDFFWSSTSSSASNQASSPLDRGAAVCGTVESPIPHVWHQKIMERMQKAMQQRMLGKESVQQILRSVQERNGPPQVLVALEKFLTACHASGMVPQTSKKRRELQQHHHLHHSPTSGL